MDVQTEKCVIIVDDSAPFGIIANIVSILSLSLGKCRPDIIGVDIVDKDGHNHIGLVQVPVPVLSAPSEKLAEIRNLVYNELSDVVSCVDFTNIAQNCMTYDDYTNTLAQSESKDLVYYGLALTGDKKKINKITGSMKLLR